MPNPDRTAAAALTTLIVLQIVMLMSLYAGVSPHPPVSTPFFGIGPFIGAAVSAAMAALILGPASTKAGRILSGLAAVLALVSFGPQKYFDAQIGLIWPAVVTAQAAVVVLGVQLFRSPRHSSTAATQTV
ncbi:hypothetical protein [Roseibium sp.]|uniref:hypothetical protein n=1 Tax=Roseibium sp. TaxID=1936156 RepID=UPI003B52A2F8